MNQMVWYIRGTSQLGSLHDQFVQGPLRLTLRGTSIVVDIEKTPVTAELSDLAASLARSYVARLAHALGESLHLLTEEEFSILPQWANQNAAMAFSGMNHRPPRDPKDIARILREVRHNSITYGWPLKVCYDYMQNALAAEDRFFPEVYKMIQTIESRLGGEAALRARSCLPHEVKLLKRLANDASLDERHAPEDGATPGAPTSAQRGEAYECAERLLRKFEELCRSEGLVG